MDLKELLTHDLSELKNAIMITSSIRANIKDFIVVNHLSKEQITTACQISGDQYYRRLNNPNLFTDQDLDMILSIISKSR